MKRFSTKLIAILSFFLLGTAFLGAQDMFFGSLSVGDGLSQYTVRDMAQDSEGMIWVATSDGLNRYDGYDFTVFRHNPADSCSLADNRLQTLAVDVEGRLWIGTPSGLSVYESNSASFRNYPSASVTALCDLGNDRILVGTSSSLAVFNYKDGHWDTLLDNVNVSSVHRAADRIFLGTHDGLIYQTALNTLQCRLLVDFKSRHSVQAIFFEEPDRLWVATEGSGLIQADADGKLMRNYRMGDGLASDYVRSLASDSFGRLWVGTVNGLDIISEGSIHHETNDPFRHGSLSHNSVRCIFRDTQDGMWLGTFYGGVNYWHPLRNHFRNIVRQQDGKSLNDNIISCIVEDGCWVWLGTNGGGVNRYDRKTGRVDVVSTFVSGQDKMAYDVKAICDGGDGYIYVGSHSGGLRRIRRSNLSVSRCGASGGPSDVYSLLPAGAGELLVGSLTGLYSYDAKTDDFFRVSMEPAIGRVWTISKDADGLIWLGTDNGVRVFSMESDGELQEHKDVSGALNDIQKPVCIHFKGSEAWIAMQEGVACYDIVSSSLKTYTTADGLPGNVTHGIEEDDWGRLWISTDRGLCCLNPFGGQIRNYTSRDGLSSDQFSDYSHCRFSNGEMWFGGMHGINYFQPEKFSDNPYSPKPVISWMTASDQEISPDDKPVVLSHNQNSVSFHFTVPNYLAWGESRFKYMLEGYSESWTEAGADRTAQYPELAPGKYVFRLQAANNDGKWCPETVSVAFRIRPVWSRTIAARVAFVLLALILVFLVMRFILERREMHRKIEQEEQEKARQEEMMQMKTRFFINLSHELRNPLQLILAPISEMQSRTDDRWMRKQLRYMDRNANRLLHLVNQLMDYRRAELGVFKLHVRPENVHKIIKENFSYFENIASSKHLSYKLDSQIEGCDMLCDDQYMELILNNLLSNAFKYTDNGSVTVRAWMDNDQLMLSVADTGLGVAKEEQEKIFERFYQADGGHIGSGIGLSLVQRLVELHHGSISLESEVGQGSTFTVSIPVSAAAYSAEELDTASEEKHSVNTAGMLAQDSVELNEKEAVNANPDRPRLLVVEDDADIRDYLEQGLEKRFLTEAVSNGREAVELLKDGHFDMVITDVNMPVMGGKELCTWIRRNPDTANIPVVAISSLAGEDEQLELLHSGADDYVTKPFSIAVLSAKLSNQLKAKKKLQASIEERKKVEDTSMTYSPADEDFLARALKVVNANLDNADFSTEDFATAMNMSRSNLHLKVKAITGASALELIRKVRFDKACEMLLDGRWTVNEIADRTGFSSASYFATCFKKHLGCLPSEYAKQHSTKMK